MPDTQISALTAAAALVGTEVLPLVQAGATVRTTAQEIADLASVTSTMALTLSNAVSALEVRVSTLEAAPPGSGSVTSTDLSAAVGVSVLATGLVSVKGLQSVVNTLSDRVSGAYDLAAAAEIHASTASAAATSVNSRVTSLETFICAGVSAHTTAGVSIKGLQSVVDAMSNRISAVVGGAGITSDQASAMIHSVLSTEYSARTSVGGATSIKGLQSVIDTLSAELVNEVSIRAVSVQTASAAASAADVHASTASLAATSADGHANTVSVAAVAADSHAELASAAATSVNSRATSINTYICATVSCVSAAGFAIGLQSVVNALSASLVSIETHASAASAAATSVDARVNTLSQTLSAVSALSVGVAANGLQSAINALSNTISAVSAAVTSVDGRVNTVSNLVSQHTVSLAQLSNATSLLNTVSAASAATSVKGLQSVINQLSNRISAVVLGGGGMTSDQASAMIASVLTTKYSARTSIGGATSTKGLQSALDDLSLQISSLNSIVSNALSAGDVISANLTSVQSTVSHLASIVSLVSCVSAAGTAVGLQSVVNALSARLIAGDSATSAEVQTASAAATSVNGRVTSVNATWTSGLGTNVAIGICTNGAANTGASFGNVSGLAVALVANGDYQIEGRVFFTLSILTGTRFGFSYNGAGNGQMVKGSMDMRCVTSVIAAAISNLVSTNHSYGHINEAQMSNVATANISITGGASATTHMLLIDGMLQNGNSAVTLNLQAAHSAAGGGINTLAGSYIRAYRLV